MLLHRANNATARARNVLRQLQLTKVPRTSVHHLVTARGVRAHFALGTPVSNIVATFSLHTKVGVTGSGIMTGVRNVSPI